ncbi:MAG: zinc ribbon domain-containing protein [Bacteroidia bacterium]
MAKNANVEEKDLSVESKLKALYELQQIDSTIDRIKLLRGELPLEVQDLEDEISGLETRLANLNAEVKDLEVQISNRKNSIKDSEALIKKYEEQQNKVRNNREFDSIAKEIEYQKLEIQLAEKRIKEAKAQIAAKQEVIAAAAANIEEKKHELESKKRELEEIIDETRKEEEELAAKSAAAKAKIDERLLIAYNRIRSNARNGLAVVTVDRDACGGCFNRIPPQRQMDIKLHKKIIVCEYCGRILVDANILGDKE